MARRGKPFEPGNKFGRGRPRGSRNKTTQAAQTLLESFAEPIVRKVLVTALQGDPKMLQLCMDRLIPVRRELPLKLGKLPVETAADLSKASELVTQRVAAGQLTLGEGNDLAELIEHRRKVIETRDLDQRVRVLEGRP